MDGNTTAGSRIPQNKIVKIRPLMDGNQMEHLTYFVKIVKIRPLMDGNLIFTVSLNPFNVKIRPLMDGNYILFHFQRKLYNLLKSDH